MISKVLSNPNQSMILWFYLHQDKETCIQNIWRSYRGESHWRWIFSGFPHLTGRVNVMFQFLLLEPQSTFGQSVSFVVWRSERESAILFQYLFQWLISFTIKKCVSYIRITPNLKNRRAISWRQLNMTLVKYKSDWAVPIPRSRYCPQISNIISSGSVCPQNKRTSI